MTRRLTAEAFGTFALVFAGTGAIVINDVSGGAISHVGIGLTFGLIVLAMIYTLGISGAHLNPAVTIGFWVARRFAAREVLPISRASASARPAASCGPVSGEYESRGDHSGGQRDAIVRA